MISFFVPGIPVPKGSRRHFVVKGTVRSVDANAKTRPWEMDIAWMAREQMSGKEPMQGALKVSVWFHMPRLKSTPKKATWHVKKPDVDKLERALLDGLKHGGVYVDDSQVVMVNKWKSYANNGPGASVTIVAAPEFGAESRERKDEERCN